MTGFSGIEGKPIKRKGGTRYLVHWRARFFMADKVIHLTTITSVFKSGFAFIFPQALPVGAELNIEIALSYQDQPTRIRLKAKVDYCLLRSNSDGADIDVITSKIASQDQHMLNNILQALSESKEFNLKQ